MSEQNVARRSIWFLQRSYRLWTWLCIGGVLAIIFEGFVGFSVPAWGLLLCFIAPWGMVISYLLCALLDPHFDGAVTFPLAALFVVVLVAILRTPGYQMVDWQVPVGVGVGMGVVFTCLATLAEKARLSHVEATGYGQSAMPGIGRLLCLMAVGTAISWAAIICANAVARDDHPVVLHATAVGKYGGWVRHRYFMRLRGETEAWGIREIRIPADVYNDAPPRMPVCILVYRGALNLRFYEMINCAVPAR